MNVWMVLGVVPIFLLVVEVLKLRRRVAYLERGRDVVRHEPPPDRGPSDGGGQADGPRRRPGTEDDGS
jgi:hypothetical protein